MTTADILSQFKNLRMLVIGDMMLDHYIWGDVNRISPEAPVPVVHVNKETFTAGGAANVALNASSLGIGTSLIGVIGNDHAGESLLRILTQKNVSTSGCISSSQTTTIVKTRVMARNQQLCRVDKESASSHYDQLNIDILTKAITEADVIILSDYAKGSISQTIINQIISLTSGSSKILCLDPKPARKLQFRNIGLITPNRHEALLLADIPEPHPSDPYPIEKVCAVIHEKFAPQLLIVTLGSDGMVVSTNGAINHILPAKAREVYDVSGAGDTVIATLAAALAAGATPKEAAQFANIAAGIVVSKMGTAHVTPDELLGLQP